MCYVCQEQESNKNCLTISMCAKEEKYCVTIRDNIGTRKFLNNVFIWAVEQESQEFTYANNYPSHQLLGDTDPVAPYCNHYSITKYLILLPGVGAILMLRIATPGSELQPGAACTASWFSPSSFAVTSPASFCHGNIHSQGWFTKMFGENCSTADSLCHARPFRFAFEVLHLQAPPCIPIKYTHKVLHCRRTILVGSDPT